MAGARARRRVRGGVGSNVGQRVDAMAGREAQEWRVARQQMTYTMRSGMAEWAEHGADWRQRWEAAVASGRSSRDVVGSERLCAVCGRELCDVMHVVMGRCAGVMEAEGYLQRLKAAIDGVAAVLPKTRGRYCPCRAQVSRAAAAVRRAKVCPQLDRVTGAEEAVRAVVGGMLSVSAGVEGMGSVERRAVEWRVAAAIGNVQDEIIAMIRGYEQRAVAKRAAARTRDEVAWQDEREEHARRVEEERRERDEAVRVAAAARERREREEREAAELRRCMAERQATHGTKPRARVYKKECRVRPPHCGSLRLRY